MAYQIYQQANFRSPDSDKVGKENNLEIGNIDIMITVEQISEIIKKISYRSDFTPDTNLYENGVLDSIGIVQLIGEIENHFGIDLPLTELERQDIQSVNAIQKTLAQRSQ